MKLEDIKNTYEKGLYCLANEQLEKELCAIELNKNKVIRTEHCCEGCENRCCCVNSELIIDANINSFSFIFRQYGYNIKTKHYRYDSVLNDNVEFNKTYFYDNDDIEGCGDDVEKASSILDKLKEFYGV